MNGPFLPRPQAALRAGLLALAAALSACGGGGGGGDAGPAAPSPSPAPSPAANQPPTAVFTRSAASVAQGQAVSFDAGASSDPEGDTLAYSWDFGDGSHGGGARIAHAYAAAGHYTATLTVSDGHGHSATATQTVDATAGPAAGPVAAVSGVVGDAAGPLAGVAVQQVGGTASATTAADGTVQLTLPSGVPLLLRLSKSGYADQLLPLALPSGAPSARFKAGLLPREAALTLDASTGGALVGKHGASVTLPPGALVDTGGHAVSGPVQVAISPLDIRGGGVAQFPGRFAGLTPDGTMEPIASHGTVEYAISAGGARLQLAPGATATVELPLYALQNLDGSAVVAGQQIPLWSLDETGGHWVQEGQGTVVASSASPSGLAMRAVVSHFSWWNVDALLRPPEPYRPLAQCFYNPGPEFVPVPKPCTIGPLLPGEYPAPAAAATTAGRARAQAAELPPGFAYRPSYAVRADVAANASVELPVPADTDFTFYACTTEGVLACGTKTVHGAAGAHDAVVIELVSTAVGNCVQPVALGLPDTRTVGIDAQTTACFDLVIAGAKQVTVGVVPLTKGLAGNKVLKDSAGRVLQSQKWFPDASDTPLVQALPPGAYHLELQSTSSLTGIVTLALTATDVPSETLSPPATRSYTMSLQGNQAVLFTPAAGTPYLATALGSNVAMRSGDGAADPGTSANGYSSLLLLPATADPLGLLLTSGRNQTVGFKLAAAPAIAAGTAQTSAVTGAADLYVKQYAFTAGAADTVAMAVRLPAGASGPQATLRLFDASGTEIDPVGSGSVMRNNTTIVATTLPAAGTYRLDLLSAGQVDIASVTARIAVLPAPVPLAFSGTSATVSASIDALADARGHQLALARGDLVRLDVMTGTTSPRLYPSYSLRVPAASGSPYLADAIGARNSLGADLPGYPIVPGFVAGHYYSDVIRVPADGSYLVHVAGGASSFGGVPNFATLEGATGPYTLTVTRPAPVPLALATTDSASVPGLGFRHYQIDVATAGDYLLCNSNGGGAVYTRVWDAAGNELAPVANGNLRTYTLATGRYDWTVTPVANTGPSTVGARWQLATDPPTAPCN